MGMKMILVYHHGCVKYTFYKCNLKILSLSPIFCEGYQ